ncbi:hypothetical protein HH214_17200 [Mucilaginibacter robiniae]|uniref:Uncharacterized protein n=1 Tax=Mucilaginibacter robiniae TaxID=2728022 RepID=A0A7L5E2Y1_9SPHI|nr:hypothetical protein [Mucilaginibacter robiniae]QJD97485.1 hypothetical protein HH214_17200 [Mucilaginibacter robiniae]
METNDNKQNGNDPSVSNDNLGENAGDSQLSKKGETPTEQNKPDNTRVDTVVPDNDSGDPGPSTDQSSNKGQGPANENL